MTKYKLVGYTEEYYKASDVEKEMDKLKCCGNCANEKCQFGHGEHCKYIFDCPLSEISSVVESTKQFWKAKG